jgi:hypothetical protein
MGLLSFSFPFLISVWVVTALKVSKNQKNFLFLISVWVVTALKVSKNKKSFLFLISVSVVIGLLSFWEIFGKFLEVP